MARGDGRRGGRTAVLAVLAVLVMLPTTQTAAAPVNVQTQMRPLSVTPGPLVGNYGVEWPVATGSGDQRFASVGDDLYAPLLFTIGGYERSGSLTAYEDDASDPDVVLYRASTNSVTRIPAPAGTAQQRPHTSGYRVVWMDNRSGNWNIWSYDDLITPKLSQITSLASDQSYPDVTSEYGDWGLAQHGWVVWQDNRNGNWDIYLYDFATKQETRITTNAADQTRPRIAGNRIVWTDERNGNKDIYWYDIAAKHEYQLSNSPLDEYDAEVCGTRESASTFNSGPRFPFTRWRAAWTVDNGVDTDCAIVHYFDSYGAIGQIAGGLGNQETPRLSDDTAVWTDTSSGSARTILYRFGGTGTFTVSASSGDKLDPDLHDRTLVWHDNRAGNDDVYAMTILQPELYAWVYSPDVYPGSGTRVMGELIGWDGMALEGRTVQIQYLPHTERLTSSQLSWHVVDTNNTAPGIQNAKTGEEGIFRATVPAQVGRCYLRAYFDGDATAFRQVSPQVVVRKRVVLTKPAGKKSISDKKSYTYHGYLKPRHTAGGGYVWIACYRKSGGYYRLKKTYKAYVSNYGSYSKYSKKIRLGREGKWRIRAVYKQTFNWETTYSSWKNITVY